MPVVILTVLGRPGQLRQALAAHVSGFLIKDTPSDQLIGLLREVAAGERVIDPKLALATLEMAESPLSEREADVLRRFAAGAEPAEIAAELFLSYGHRPQLPGDRSHEGRRPEPDGGGSDRRGCRMAIAVMCRLHARAV